MEHPSSALCAGKGSCLTFSSWQEGTDGFPNITHSSVSFQASVVHMQTMNGTLSFFDIKPPFLLRKFHVISPSHDVL